MKIDYRVGDLLESGLNYIAHGCNAQRKMGSGIALSIRNKWSVVYKEYSKGDMSLGNVIVVETEDCVVFNCITQEFYGRNPSIRYVSYEAVEKCIKNIDNYFSAQHNEHIPLVGFPMIGAGLANGDWNIIEKIIEEGAVHFQPVVYTLELMKREY